MIGPYNLVLRCDANVAMGTGHVMRCLALAQAWQDAGGQATFAMIESTPPVEDRIRREGFEVVKFEAAIGHEQDVVETIRIVRELGALWTVVDGYKFGADYQTNLQRGGIKALFVDDNGDSGYFPADVVLNQNAHARESMYPNRAASTSLLLGSQYVLLRREFTSWRTRKREIHKIGNRVLIAMGGSDPDDLSSFAVRALADAKFEGLKISVVAGGSNPHRRALESAMQQLSASVDLHWDAANMAELMFNADIALIAAGGTLWEALFMGCAVVSFARNPLQQNIVQDLENDGAVIKLERNKTEDTSDVANVVHRLVYSQDCRLQLSAKGQKLVDGRGAARVIDALLGRANPL